MNRTTTAFRLLLKRERLRQLALFDDPTTPYVYHVIATNWPLEQKAAQEVLDWHNQRGQAENFTKELKHGFGWERLPCGETWANAVWCRLGVIAHNLVLGVQAPGVSHRLGTPHSRHAAVEVRAGGRPHRPPRAGQGVLTLVVNATTLALFRGIRQQCWALRGVT